MGGYLGAGAGPRVWERRRPGQCGGRGNEEMNQHDAPAPEYKIPAPTSKGVLYLCDHRACEICRSRPDDQHDCQHTSDIRHAKNFYNVHGLWVERLPAQEDEEGGP